jgi:hypothetical protein
MRSRLAAWPRTAGGLHVPGWLRGTDWLRSAGSPGAAAGLARRAAPVLRRHWLIAVLMAGGLVLRVISQIAYRPALLYIDSLKYLYNAWPGTDPLGYEGVLKAILLVGNLQVVAAVQHLVGLAVGVAIYALLLRRGVPRWLSALAAAPVLLDAYELQMEQTIMPDVWFEALMVAGLLALLWQPRLTFRAIAVGGALLGLSATVWQGGEFLILPAVVFTAIGTGGWRRKMRAAGVMCVAFAVPILVYMTGSLVFSGHFWLSRSGTSSVYGRVAEAADCSSLQIPSYERVLCPTPSQRALGPDGLDHDPSSPLTSYEPPTGLDQSAVVSSFTWSVVTQQPLRVLGSIGSDASRLFEVSRVTSPGDTPISRWQFQTYYPGYQNYVRTNRDDVIIVGLKVQNPPPDYIYQPLDPSMGGKAQVTGPMASFLRAYQLDGGFTPGPLYLFATAVGLAGTLFLVRRKNRRDVLDSPGQAGGGQRAREFGLACCLFFITPVALLLASDIPEFSWRYQLPAIVTLPAAGALGIAVILAELRGGAGGRTADAAAGELVTTSRGGGTSRTRR